MGCTMDPPSEAETRVLVTGGFRALQMEAFDALRVCLKQRGLSDNDVERKLSLYRAFWHERILSAERVEPEGEEDEMLHLHLLHTEDYERFCRSLKPKDAIIFNEDYYLYRHEPQVARLEGASYRSIGWAAAYARWSLRRDVNFDPASDPVLLSDIFVHPEPMNQLLAYLVSDEGAFTGDEARARAGIFGYVRYFVAGEPSPTDKIDEDRRTVWEAHVLFTSAYRSFCRVTRDELVHYRPL